MINNVLLYLEESAKKNPIKTACADENLAYTYVELYERAKSIGTVLSGKVQPCFPVPVFMDKGCRALSAFMGIVYAGCFYVMLDSSQPAVRINMILETLGSNLVIVDEASVSKFQKLEYQGEVMILEEIDRFKIDDSVLSGIRAQATDIDPLYSIFTSGSTGVPKGVIVNHRSVIDFIEYFTDIFDIWENDVIGNQAPFDFDVSVKDIYSALKVGATIQIIPKKLFSFPMKLLDFLEERGVTTLVWAVSALCIVTTLNGFAYKIPSYINKIIFSGEVMPIKHLNMWRRTYPDGMFANVYGPTEITCNCTYYIVDRDFELDDMLPMGQAFPNERVFLLDDNNMVTPADTGKLGEICVSGTAVTMGYYNNDEKTGQAFVQNPLNNRYIELIYRTGDLGFYNERGEMCFSSRKDFQIKHMGHRIELGEIEMAVNAVEDVFRVCCIFDQDDNKIIGFYEGTAEKKHIVRELNKKLPKFMIPNIFEQIAAMPITKNGKIDRNTLLNDYKSSQQDAEAR